MKEKGGTIPAPDGGFYKQERHADKLQRTAGTPDSFKSTAFLSTFFSFVYQNPILKSHHNASRGKNTPAQGRLPFRQSESVS